MGFVVPILVGGDGRAALRRWRASFHPGTRILAKGGGWTTDGCSGKRHRLHVADQETFSLTRYNMIQTNRARTAK